MKTTYATIKGIEVMRALGKGQASIFYKDNPLGGMASESSFRNLS